MRFLKQKKVMFIILFVCAFCLFFNKSTTVFAEGWEGMGTISGAGGGIGGNCESVIGGKGWMVDCTGTSWIFYKAGSVASGNVTLPYSEDGGTVTTSDGKDAYIPKECSEHTDQDGGFWAYGHNAAGIAYYDNKDFNTGGKRGSITGVSGYEHFYGHWKPTTWPSYENNYNTSIDNGSPKQEIGVYEFDHTGTVKEVLKAYNAYLVSEGKSKVSELPDGLYGFCYWDGMSGVTLTGKAISAVNGKSLSKEPGLEDRSKTVQPKATATITRGKNDSYVFKGWRETKTGNIVTGKKDYSKKMGNKDEEVFAVYAPYRKLSGLAVVNDGECTRMSDYDPDSVKVTWGDEASISAKPITNLTFLGWKSGGCSGSFISKNETYTVNPLKSNTEVYAVYEVKPLPCSGGDDSKTESTCNSTIDINHSKDNSTCTKADLYMKPGDTVYVEGSFDPQYQEEKNSIPQFLSLAGDTNWTDNTGSKKNSLESYIPTRYKHNWNNAFSILHQCGTNWCYYIDVEHYSNTIGKNGRYSGHGDYRATLGTKVAKKSAINLSDFSFITPRQVDFSYDGDYNLYAKINTNSAESRAVTAYTPYNFENNISDVLVDSETTPGDKTELISGGEKTFKFKISTDPIYNSAVGDTYATAVPNASWKLEYYWYDEKRGDVERTFSVPGSGYSDIYHSTSSTVTNKEIMINIPDLPAGTRFCVRAGVWPHSSRYPGQEYTNWEHPNGDNAWAWSSMRCFVIAKKPSFQVWGGGVYSAGGFETSVMKKKHLNGVNAYDPIDIDNGKVHVFSSWTELNLVANGQVKGFASGAGTGYDGPNFSAYPGGSTEVKGNNSGFCIRSPLSFANSKCLSGYVGGLENNIAYSSASSEKSALISRFSGENAGEYEYNEDITEFSGTINKTVTKIINAKDKDFTITGNIIYADDGYYETLDEIPKLIIYAKNIYINCGVTRVDAILIADNEVNTCNDGNINSKNRSNQLKINGSIVTGTLKLNRTYGAATGTNSIVPAEIINYDSSLYLWANKEADVNNTGRITTTYSRELPPRY